jgi:hypothetical protein
MKAQLSSPAAPRSALPAARPAEGFNINAGRAKCRQMVAFRSNSVTRLGKSVVSSSEHRIFHISVTVFIRIWRIGFCIRAKS